MRIVSLVPSITQTLFDFGLDHSEIVGRTKFCIHPADRVKEVSVIGGTKNLKPDKIKALKPDLIIANKEENDREQVLELEKEFRVWVTDIKTLEDHKSFLHELGQVLHKPDEATHFIQKTDNIFGGIKPGKSIPTAYLIWKGPYMTVGGDTFIHDIMSRLGLLNIFGKQLRYPTVEFSELQTAELVLLSSEPYPFKQKHIAELQEQLPNATIMLADGEAFSWYGTRILQYGSYFHQLTGGLEEPFD